MRYRRNETLRYTFEEPLSAGFKLIKVDKKSVNSSMGSGSVIDISPGGMRLASGVHIPTSKTVHLFVATSLAGHDLSFTAEVIWMKPAHGQYHYGLDFIGDHQEEVIQALKKHNQIKDKKPPED
ncbi:PilZ domain-containing protein [Halobacillus sp. B29]|uniref:PilZ domain-containing protein n=1 Tax=Halobacillus sp. B29 TaxID=3457432 RepID=UPI003FCECB68